MVTTLVGGALHLQLEKPRFEAAGKSEAPRDRVGMGVLFFPCLIIHLLFQGRVMEPLLILSRGLGPPRTQELCSHKEKKSSDKRCVQRRQGLL